MIRSPLRLRRALPLLLALSAVGVAAEAAAGATPALALAPVAAFPSPGAGFAAPQTTIAFRGLPAEALGMILVRGSVSGVHAGAMRADSDGNGASFLPAQPFRPGETVTVNTALNVLGAVNGSFRFRIAVPARPIRAIPSVPVARVNGDVLRFHSRPDLTPAAVVLDRNTRRARAQGDYFLASQDGPLSNGPTIYDAEGNLVFYKPMPRGVQASDVRVQSLAGIPLLTWWQGILGPGVGRGVDEIYDNAGHHLGTVHAANGLSADLHEFALTGAGTALITAYYPVIDDARAVHGSAHAAVLDSIVQELDLRTGNVLFQWDGLDHVPLTESVLPPPSPPFAYDPIHLNSADLDADGNVIISARNTSTILKVDHRTGAVQWRLGGKRSSFRLPPGARFAFQHDAHIRAAGDRLVTLFDDGAGPPVIHKLSRGITLQLNFRTHSARLVRQLMRPPLLANFEGNLQDLGGGDALIGWGQQPYFTEFDPAGRILAEGHIVGSNTIYRVYRFPWRSTPARTVPALATQRAGGQLQTWMSWNGATTVVAWRILTGTSPTGLRAARTVPRHGFETAATVTPAPYVQVQALGSGGAVLGTSKVHRTG